MFKVGDKVKLNDNVIRLSVDITDAEVEIIGITEEGLYELGIPKADIALHGDYLEPVDDKEEQDEYFTGKAMYLGEELKDFVSPITVGYTAGRIYEFANGFTRDDHGDKRPFPSLDVSEAHGLTEGDLVSFGFYPITD